MPAEKTVRFPPIPPEQMNDEQKQLVKHYQSSWRAAFKTMSEHRLGGARDAMLRSPKLAMCLSNLSTYFRPGMDDSTQLQPRLNELAIMVVAREWASQHIWQAHSKAAAIEAGLSAQLIDELFAGRRPSKMQADEEIIYDFLIELQRERRVKDETFARAKAVLGERQLIDLIGVSGYYTLVAMELAAIDAPPPDPALPLLKPLDKSAS